MVFAQLTLFRKAGRLLDQSERTISPSDHLEALLDQLPRLTCGVTSETPTNQKAASLSTSVAVAVGVSRPVCVSPWSQECLLRNIDPQRSFQRPPPSKWNFVPRF